MMKTAHEVRQCGENVKVESGAESAPATMRRLRGSPATVPFPHNIPLASRLWASMGRRQVMRLFSSYLFIARAEPTIVLADGQLAMFPRS